MTVTTGSRKKIGWVWGTLFLVMTVCAQAADVSWSGAVRNGSGDPLAAATVRLANDHDSLTATTDDAGQFHFGNLKPGAYRLSITPAGKKASESYPVQITAQTAAAE